MWHPIRHFRTISKHHHLVMRYCFRCGLYRQGILHDLSKLSPVEFFAGAKYYQGNCSPNNAQRKRNGYSAAWLHHKGRNKHHLEYWIDYNTGSGYPMSGLKMPDHYLAEMICDRIAASKTYNGKNYDDSFPLAYYQKSRDHYLLHPETRAQLEYALTLLKEEGEDALFAHLRKKLKKRPQK